MVGAGLAGCEAALSLAEGGRRVRLLEQKPRARTPAQSSDGLAELVCSNSLRGAALTNAVGLLKEEMRRLGSFIMRAADRCHVPAGGALAVDRERFSATLTEWVHAQPNIELVSEVVGELPEARPLVIATGPLTADGLAGALADRLGQQAIAYYDAIAPIVAADSIDWSRVFRGSRWDKGETDRERSAYVNCPLSADQYSAFVQALLAADQVAPRAFEEVRYFEGCLPIEVMAERGEKTLSFGPMKPVGLVDPRTLRRPHAVVQLRQEDAAATAYNLVGFQTRLTRPAQAAIFRQIPGLERAEFLRWGAVHRNTFVDAPRHLDESLQLRGEPGVYLAGQITGVEGYVESAACGWLCAHFVAARLDGRVPNPPPPTTAHGALLRHLARQDQPFQPSNVNFSLLAPWEGDRLHKRARYQAMADRALGDLARWMKADRVGGSSSAPPPGA